MHLACEEPDTKRETCNKKGTVVFPFISRDILKVNESEYK